MRVVLSRLAGPCISRYFAVETVTVAVFESPPTVAVIVVVPFVAAALEVKLTVAIPLAFTVVALESDPIAPSVVLQLTVEPVGMTVPPPDTESVNVVIAPPVVSVCAAGERVKVGTVMSAEAVCVDPFGRVHVAVIFAVPLLTAVTVAVEAPLETTVATPVLLEVQLVMVPT